MAGLLFISWGPKSRITVSPYQQPSEQYRHRRGFWSIRSEYSRKRNEIVMEVRCRRASRPLAGYHKKRATATNTLKTNQQNGFNASCGEIVPLPQLIITTAATFAFRMHYRVFLCLNASSQSLEQPPGVKFLALVQLPLHICSHTRTTAPVLPIFISRLVHVC